MSQLEVLAETVKLARFLGVQVETLDYLRPLDAAQLRQLRERLSDAEFARSRPMFQRVAQASRLLPNALVALIGEKVFGAMLCARIAGLMPVDRALDLAMKMPDAFLADVAVELDPRSAREVIAAMPTRRVVPIALILVGRGDFITMGRFVGYLPEPVIAAAIKAVTSEEALLRAAFFIESKEKLNALIGLLPQARLRASILLAADDRSGLWTEALALMGHANRDWKRRIGDMAAAEDPAVLSSMLQAAQRLKVWDSVLPIVGCMSAANQRKLAALPDLADTAVLNSIIQAAQDNDLWSDLLPLVRDMAEPARRAAAQMVEQLPSAVLLKLLATAGEHDLWADLVGMIRLMDTAARRRLLQLIGAQDQAVLHQLLLAMDRAGLWGEILLLIGDMDAHARKLMAQQVPRLAQDMRLRLIETVDRLDLWPDLLALSADMEETELHSVAELIAQQPQLLLQRLLRSIGSHSLWPQLLPIAARMRSESLQQLGLALASVAECRAEVEAQSRRLGLQQRLAALFIDATMPHDACTSR